MDIGVSSRGCNSKSETTLKSSFLKGRTMSDAQINSEGNGKLLVSCEPEFLTQLSESMRAGGEAGSARQGVDVPAASTPPSSTASLVASGEGSGASGGLFDEKTTAQLEKSQGLFKSVGKSIEGDLAKGFEKGVRSGGDFSGMLDGMLNHLTDLAFKSSGIGTVFDGLFSGVTGALAGGGKSGGGIGGFFGSILSGFRATGGSVQGNSAYMVGEQGPELFIPSGGGGTIVPNDRLGGGGASVNQNVTIHVGSSGNAAQNADLAKQVGQVMETQTRAIIRDELLRQMSPGNLLNPGIGAGY
jgi:hypothetical protein